jgi:4-hydroxy-4-methyl-2-oxoglutarate aldolase
MMQQDHQAFANPPLDAETLELLRNLDTCAIANSIEATGVRLRNEGYTDSTIHCLFPELPPLVGYALPLRVRTGEPPIGGLAYVDRVDWWERFLAIPQPRVLVVEDEPGGAASGSILGEVHANIYRALGCAGIVTNGAARDLPALRRLGFPVFASHVSVSHAYAHVIAVGDPVTVGGLQIRTGDLLYGDGHGILSIPLQVAQELPAIAARQKKQEQAIIEYCHSTEFTVEGLKRLLVRNQK